MRERWCGVLSYMLYLECSLDRTNQQRWIVEDHPTVWEHICRQSLCNRQVCFTPVNTWVDFSFAEWNRQTVNFITFPRSFSNLLQCEQELLWKVGMGQGGQWEGFSLNQRIVFLLWAPPWKELLERLNPSCALVNVFKIFFFQQLLDLGVSNSLLNRLSKRHTQLALLSSIFDVD